MGFVTQIKSVESTNKRFAVYSSDFEWDKQAAKSPERWIKDMSSDAVMLIIILLISVQNF